MKSFTKNFVALFALGIFCGNGGASERAQLMEFNETSLLTEGQIIAAPFGNVSNKAFAPVNESAKVRQDASGMTWSYLVDEDFSKMTSGSINEPDTVPLCTYYGAASDVYIDPIYTQQPGWSGSNAFQAGGAILMKEGPLNTPLGDFSGDLTISFRYKIGPGCTRHSEVIIDVLKGGINGPQIADCDFNLFQCHVYPGQDEWRYAEMTCRNNSANNDGFIQFNCYGEVLIDDIKVMAKHDFIAPPVLKPITDFTGTSFTANWEPVNLATFYYMQLQKRVYSSDETEVIYNLDFEDITGVPDGWVISDFSQDRIVDEGKNGSKGLKMTNGDYIETPYNFAKYNWLRLYGQLFVPEGITPQNIKGNVKFSLRTKNGWQQLSSAMAAWFYEPWEFDFAEELFPSFNDNYYGIKIEVSGLNEGAYLVFDDFEFQTGRPSHLETIIGFNNYVSISRDNCSYTFTNLDPESEYYYGVKSFYQGIYSEEVSEHAFGVAAPALLPASDVTATSYTANWESAPKATGYQITNFGVFESQKDYTEYTIIEEDFSKITSEITSATTFDGAEYLNNYQPTSLDAYTLLPGWTGCGNSIFQGGIGVIDSYYSLYYIQTPPLTLDNDDYFVLSLMGQIKYDDTLVVWVNNQSYKLPLTAGDFAGEFEIPERGNEMPIMFYTTNGAPFCLEYVAVAQNLKAGQKIFTFLSSSTTDNDVNSFEFTGLSSDYDYYAYDVKSIFEFEDETTYSVSDYYMIVDLSNGSSSQITTDVEELNIENIEPEWYGIDGVRLDGPRKGICIAKYPDGTVKKIFIR